MIKMEKKTVEFYDFIDMKHHVDEVLGFDQRDYHRQPEWRTEGAAPEFNEWHKEKGLPDVDPDGKNKGSSQIWFKEYQEDTKNLPKREYMDFWHFQTEYCVGDRFANDTYSTVYLGKAEDHYKYDEMKKFQIHCQNVWHEEFKHLLKDGENWLDVWVSW